MNNQTEKSPSKTQRIKKALKVKISKVYIDTYDCYKSYYRCCCVFVLRLIN